MTDTRYTVEEKIMGLKIKQLYSWLDNVQKYTKRAGIYALLKGYSKVTFLCPSVASTFVIKLAKISAGAEIDIVNLLFRLTLYISYYYQTCILTVSIQLKFTVA